MSSACEQEECNKQPSNDRIQPDKHLKRQRRSQTPAQVYRPITIIINGHCSVPMQRGKRRSLSRSNRNNEMTRATARLSSLLLSAVHCLLGNATIGRVRDFRRVCGAVTTACSSTFSCTGSLTVDPHVAISSIRFTLCLQVRKPKYSGRRLHTFI
jgi:hypothetical protein